MAEWSWKGNMLNAVRPPWLWQLHVCCFSNICITCMFYYRFGLLCVYCWHEKTVGNLCCEWSSSTRDLLYCLLKGRHWLPVCVRNLQRYVETYWTWPHSKGVTQSVLWKKHGVLLSEYWTREHTHFGNNFEWCSFTLHARRFTAKWFNKWHYIVK